VVDEAVALAKRRVRKRAGGLVNAVLRKLAADVQAIQPTERWTESRDDLPFTTGRIKLSSALLPGADDWQKYWSVATSHGPALVERWSHTLGSAQAQAVCRQGVKQPPTIIAVEAGFDAAGPVASASGGGADEMRPAVASANATQNEPLAAPAWMAHEQPGFVVWQGGHDALVDFLAANPARRVQDSAAAQAVKATGDLRHDTILDLCAGRGTKTRQLAVTHPGARIVATDHNRYRRAELADLASQLDNVELASFDALPSEKFDLVLLDVPCSNTAVLARRPEARYRFSQNLLHELTQTQRRIIDAGLARVCPGGHLLYTTCSLDAAENEEQTSYIEQQTGGEVIREDRWLPAGEETSYHDGSYHACIRV